MTTKRKVEVFTSGCALCDDTVAMVQRLACPSCDPEIRDLRQATVAAEAKRRGITRAPAVVIDGRLADCCATIGRPDEQVLRAAGVGRA
jgi:hypothetical protein